RPQPRIAAERAREEAVEIVEAGLRDALAISGVKAPARRRCDDRRRPQGRCVGKGAEPVATHCDIGGEEARPAPSPLPDEGSRPPAAVLIGCTEIVLVAGVELLRS